MIVFGPVFCFLNFDMNVDLVLFLMDASVYELFVVVKKWLWLRR